MQYKTLNIITRKEYAAQHSKRGVWRRCTIETDPAIWETLCSHAKTAGCSTSELVRSILGSWCTASTDDNPQPQPTQPQPTQPKTDSSKAFKHM